MRWDWLSRNADVVLDDLQQHIEITVAALALGAVIAFPIGLIAYRWRVTYGPLLAITQPSASAISAISMCSCRSSSTVSRLRSSQPQFI